MAETTTTPDAEFLGEGKETLEGPPKLTDWKKEPELSVLKEDVFSARPLQQEHMVQVQKWLNNLNVTGPAAIKKRKGRSTVQPKLIRKQAEWRYAALSEPFLSADKVFTVSPVSWEDKKAAAQNELLLNWQFDTKLNAVVLMDQLARTCVDEGTAVIRVGWDRITKMEMVEVPVWGYFPMDSEEQIQALTEAMGLQAENPRAFDELPDDIKEAVRYSIEVQEPMMAEIVGYEEVEQEKVLRNQPTAEVININNLVVDATCGADIDKALFMAMSTEVTRSYLRTNSKFKNLEYVNWESHSLLSQPDHVTQGPAEVNFKDEARQKVTLEELWGLWDIEGDGHLVPIYVAWIGNTMVCCEKNPYPDGKPPFVIVPYLPQKQKFYGQPDGELLEDNQKIQGAVLRGIIDMMARSANGQRGMAKNMLDVTNRRRYEEGEDYEFNPNAHPSNSIVEHKFPEIPQSAMGMISMTNMDGEALTGVKTYSDQGLTGSAFGRVAANANNVMSAMSQREAGILRRLSKAVSDLGSKIVAMNQEFLSEEEVVHLTNEEFVTIRRDELHGNFDLKCMISSAEEDNAKAQELSFMLQTTAPNGDPELVKMMLSEIFRLRRMPDLAQKVATYQPEPSPMEQLEMQKVQLEIEKIQAEVAKLNADAELAMARARESGSKADKADLDYVEQETGTKHARDIDRIGQQAEANQNLKITQGIIDTLKTAGKGKPGEGPSGPSDQEVGKRVMEAHGFNQISRQGL